MKKLLSVFALLSVVLTVPTAASAEYSTEVYMNGSKVAAEVNPQILNGTTFVPMRAIAERLGFKVTWNQLQQKASLEKGNKHIELMIGNREVQVNGTKLMLETAPYITAGNSMLPVRFLGEQLGLEVAWEPSVNAVFLNDRAASKIANLTTPIDHIVVVVEENHSYDQIVGNPKAPYMQSLIARGALFTNAHGTAHPSQPNYLTLFSGSAQGVTDDGCKKPFQSPNLATELMSANLAFTGYSEDLPKTGFTGCSSKGYARKHNPWVQFSNVPQEANRPFSDFPQDFSKLPAVSFVIPNHQDDMHDGTVQQADDWLKTNLDSYTVWAQTHRSLLIVTWDEDDYAKDNHIPLIVLGPMVKPGEYGERVDHKNVLRTIEAIFQLQLFRDTEQVEPITSIWK